MKLNVNVGIIIQKCEACGIKCKDFECCLEYTDVKDDLTCINVCVVAGNSKKIDENLRKQLTHTCRFSNHDIKFILLLQKYVYPYKYITY